MKNRIFNSLTETGLRILLLLKCASKMLSLEEITVADFVATYSRNFNVGQQNLNGNGEFALSEFAFRRQSIIESLEFLKEKDLLEKCETTDGVKYIVTKPALVLIENIDSSYADKYVEQCKQLFKSNCELSISTIVSMANKRTCANVVKEKKQ